MLYTTKVRDFHCRPEEYNRVREMIRSEFSEFSVAGHPAGGEFKKCVIAHGKDLTLKVYVRPPSRWTGEIEALNAVRGVRSAVQYEEAGVRGGHYYIIMERLNNELFGKAMRDLPKDRVIGALKDVWYRGVSHNDVNTYNICIRKGQLVLIDFEKATLEDTPFLESKDFRSVIYNPRPAGTVQDQIIQKTTFLCTPEEYGL